MNQLKLNKEFIYPLVVDEVCAMSHEVTVHPTAIIDAGATIGKGCFIWHWTHICAGARIGEACSFGQNVYVGHDVLIGNRVKVQNNVSIYDAVTLEDDVFCGPSMVFTNVMNPRSAINRKNAYRRTLVKKGASIGANATIICGHTIGEYAFVGAGAVVTTDVPAYALVVGMPARQLGWICQCGERLLGTMADEECQYCYSRYHITQSNCQPIKEASHR